MRVVAGHRVVALIAVTYCSSHRSRRSIWRCSWTPVKCSFDACGRWPC